jgi:hypothetical protein
MKTTNSREEKRFKSWNGYNFGHDAEMSTQKKHKKPNRSVSHPHFQTYRTVPVSLNAPLGFIRYWKQIYKANAAITRPMIPAALVPNW